MSWTDEAIRDVLTRLRRQRNDDGHFEAKSCAHDIGSSVWESVSAFANTSGGTLLLGISEKDGFRPTDGFDQNRIVAQFMEGMGDGNPQGTRLTNPPEYEISRCEYESKPFLAIDISENPIALKPCYMTAKGPKSGGYRRMDDKDIRLSPTEIFEFENALTPSPADRSIVAEATTSDLNDEAVDHILTAHKDSKALRGTTQRIEQLARLNVTDNDGNIRLAGLLAAGQYPQQYYPKLLIDVQVHPDIEKSSPSGPRFLDRTLCDGNMPEAIDQAVEAVARNLRTPTFVVGAGAKTDTEIPREVLREIIANAVIHREYDARFTGQSVTVDVYPDRVEVTNPGGLWGGVTLSTIADGESRCRNATLMQLMQQIPYSRDDAVTAEGGGTGIPLVIREMQARTLGTPQFEARPDCFKVILARYDMRYTWNQQWPDQPRTNMHQHESPIISMNGVPTAEKQNTLTAVERDVLASLSPTNPHDVHEISQTTGRSLQMVRRALRKLIDADLAVPTAPASSRQRKYLSSS